MEACSAATTAAVTLSNPVVEAGHEQRSCPHITVEHTDDIRHDGSDGSELYSCEGEGSRGQLWVSSASASHTAQREVRWAGQLAGGRCNSGGMFKCHKPSFAVRVRASARVEDAT